MKIAILGYDDCLGQGFIGAADLLAMSCRLLKTKERPAPYSVVTVSYDGKPLRRLRPDARGRRFLRDARHLRSGDCPAIPV